MDNEKDNLVEPGHDLTREHEDPYIEYLHRIIRFAVKVLAALMVLVIDWGIGDVIYVLYQGVSAPPLYLLSINDILTTFAAFLAVLIAIEIFINISMCLKTDVIPVLLVVATALMAISRKVIIFDFAKNATLYFCNCSSSVCSWNHILAYFKKSLTSQFTIDSVN